MFWFLSHPAFNVLPWKGVLQGVRLHSITESRLAHCQYNKILMLLKNTTINVHVSHMVCLPKKLVSFLLGGLIHL